MLNGRGWQDTNRVGKGSQSEKGVSPIICTGFKKALLAFWILQTIWSTKISVQFV